MFDLAPANMQILRSHVSAHKKYESSHSPI